MKGLGLYCILVVKLKINQKVGFGKYWLYFLLEHKQTNKQFEHITTKGFIILQFLQKLSSQIPFWDEARLSSLVNKRYDEWPKYTYFPCPLTPPPPAQCWAQGLHLRRCLRHGLHHRGHLQRQWLRPGGGLSELLSAALPFFPRVSWRGITAQSSPTDRLAVVRPSIPLLTDQHNMFITNWGYQIPNLGFISNLGLGNGDLCIMPYRTICSNKLI